MEIFEIIGGFILILAFSCLAAALFNENRSDDSEIDTGNYNR